MYDGEEVGYLTYEQFSRFRRAVHYSLLLVPWLRVAGYIRGGDGDEVRSAAVHPALGLPPTWVAAEDITLLTRELQGWADLEDVARDEYGADIAIQFTREVETAGHKWPFEDRAHSVQYVRCPDCQYASLRYEPPQFAGDVIAVRCKECRHLVPEDEFTQLAVLIAAELAVEKEKREKRLGDHRASNGENAKVKADYLQVGGVRESAHYAANADIVA